MEDLRKEFPVLSKYTYLNTASSGLISRSLLQWRREHDQKLMEDASVFRDAHRLVLEGVKKEVAQFMDASHNEIALVPNFSFGLNTLLEGLPQKQKVLLLEKDYPSVNWAFEHRDFDVCYAAIDEHLEQNIERAVVEHQPDIFAFSLVQYLNGIKIDLTFLKQLKAYHPALLLIADGTQYVGTEVFSFSESPIDILGASCYKWLLAGYGNGFFIVKDIMHSKIFPSTIGFNSAEAMYSKREEISFMKHFEPGHQDTLNYGSLGHALQHLQTIGMETVSKRVRTLSSKAKTQFVQLGLLEASVVQREQHSNIFSIKGDEALFQKLKEENIICSQRGHGIRVGFHFYNTEADLDKLLSVVR
ncbi:aminotransferase class V-fold PLP-dependent enzyme [Altibacter sp.]|uniref:aminotransferase class V-fold PLP-dependent enzyme n=1 Tax=Altibacter sp. TaxID=2024823 RepID=UPI000C97F9DB|nr:aminotransferase class V-fold PLP-dependent enzyme [Altibacter sp.]MAP53338.1 aminotransferase [Altibacter sp.]